MPKWYKPRLEEADSVWSDPSAEMARRLIADKEIILGNLRFYCEHDRPDDFDGKFASHVRAEEELVLAEIAGILTLAASVSATLSPGVLIATLRRVSIEPTLIFRPKFPSEVACIVADFYQRNRETPGTFWPDIMGEKPASFPGGRRKPTSKQIKAAACSALISLRNGRTAGRPIGFAVVVLARKLGDLFRRYSPKITRHSLDSSPHQIDGGPFFEFAEAVLKPLQAYLRIAGLPPVSASTIARHAVKAQNMKITRETFGTLFHP